MGPIDFSRDTRHDTAGHSTSLLLRSVCGVDKFIGLYRDHAQRRRIYNRLYCSRWSMISALAIARVWAEGDPSRTCDAFGIVFNGWRGALTADSTPLQHCRPGAATGRRRTSFTQAQVRRAVKAVESAGLKVTKIAIDPGGTITINSENAADLIPNKDKLASWDE
jgi:hypothetical protein